MSETILITGASRGIGRALAEAASAQGLSVIGTQRGAADPIPGVETMALDVTDAAGPAALATALGDRPVDILVCNAGIYEGRGRIGETAFAADAWARTFAVNVAGVFLTIEALLPALRRAGQIGGRPRIGVISSQMGSSERAGGGSYIYRASKAAATNLAVNLALDLKGDGIAVAAYHPGWVRTDMGGAQAAIGMEESAAGLMARLGELTLDRSGGF
ncbi:MAG: SDR family NAD(P)-dependent oxidoreductase, partial [Pseudomonadota bacterium]